MHQIPDMFAIVLSHSYSSPKVNNDPPLFIARMTMHIFVPLVMRHIIQRFACICEQNSDGPETKPFIPSYYPNVYPNLQEIHNEHILTSD